MYCVFPEIKFAPGGAGLKTSQLRKMRSNCLQTAKRHNNWDGRQLEPISAAGVSELKPGMCLSVSLALAVVPYRWAWPLLVGARSDNKPPLYSRSGGHDQLASGVRISQTLRHPHSHSSDFHNGHIKSTSSGLELRTDLRINSHYQYSQKKSKLYSNPLRIEPWISFLKACELDQVFRASPLIIFGFIHYI